MKDAPCVGITVLEVVDRTLHPVVVLTFGVLFLPPRLFISMCNYHSDGVCEKRRSKV